MASNEFKLILNLILPKGSKSHILPRKNEFARINFKKYILYAYIWRINLQEYISRKKSDMEYIRAISKENACILQSSW